MVGGCPSSDGVRRAPSRPPDAEELSHLARLATRYVFESEALLTYVMLIAGKSSRN